jgi:hypothetical protein
VRLSDILSFFFHLPFPCLPPLAAVPASRGDFD